MPLPFSRRALQTAPSFSRDFAGLKTLDHGVGPAITFTRASNATFFDASGTLQTAANDTPRFDHSGGNSLGLLIEEQRTNLIRNNTMVGAVAGTPGTLPSNGWTITDTAGYTINVAGVGVESGINYIDFEVTIAAGSISSGMFFADTPTGSPSVSYTGSLWMRRISGTMPRVRFIWQDGAGGLGTTSRSFFDISDNWVRYADTFSTVAGSNVIRFQIGAEAPAGGGTFVIRVGMPQTELGAFATSVIPTTAATATRSADSAVVTPISSFYNQAEGTLFAEASFSAVGANSNRAVFAASDNSVDNRNYILFDNAQQFIATNASAAQASIDAGTITTSGSKVAAAYKQDDFAASLNGAAAVTDTLGTPALALTHLTIGRRFSTDSSQVILNGCIAKLAYWPRRLSNSLLQQLTT